MTIFTHRCGIHEAIFLLFLLTLPSRSQINYTLSESDQQAMSTSLSQVTEGLVQTVQEPGRTDMILQAISAAPPASLLQLVPCDPGESHLDATVRRIKSSNSLVFAEIRDGQSHTFSSVDERIWVAKQYVYFLALVTDTDNLGGELPKVWAGRQNDTISKADEFQLRILVEIGKHIQRGSSLSEEAEQNLWVSSAGDVNSYGRFCTLVVARKAISRQSVFEEVLSSYLAEENTHILDQLIRCIQKSGNIVFAEQAASDLIANNAALSLSQRTKLQEITER